MSLRSSILKALNGIPQEDVTASMTDEELNKRLVVLHRDGDIQEAAALLKAYRPWDVCDWCHATGADHSDMVWTYAGPQPGICSHCDGTGSKSKRPVWGEHWHQWYRAQQEPA